MTTHRLDGDDLPVYSPTCAFCRHFDRSSERSCAAFLKGIPDPIWKGENDHRKPYPGDGGIRFEPVRKET